MSIKEQHLTVTRTARYYTLGELNQKTTTVWLVLHGYGMAAIDFIDKFKSLNDEKTFVIAPEALSRFYLKGFGGKVGATWMTREDRESDIKDYVHYIQQVYEHFDLGKQANLKIVTLGFSQGAAALSRWIEQTRSRIDLAVFYAGEIATEVIEHLQNERWSEFQKVFCIGNRDEFITQEIFTKYQEILTRNSIEVIPFDGTHEVTESVLEQLRLL